MVYFDPADTLTTIVRKLEADRDARMGEQAAPVTFPLVLTASSPTSWDLPAAGLSAAGTVELPPLADVEGKVYRFQRVGVNTVHAHLIFANIAGAEEIGAGYGTDGIEMRQEGDQVFLVAKRTEWDIIARRHEQVVYAGGHASHQPVAKTAGFVICDATLDNVDLDLYEIASYMASTADELVVHRWDNSGNVVTLHAHANDSINGGAAGGTLVVPANSTVRLKPVVDPDNLEHRWITV